MYKTYIGIVVQNGISQVLEMSFPIKYRSCGKETQAIKQFTSIARVFMQCWWYMQMCAYKQIYIYIHI